MPPRIGYLLPDPGAGHAGPPRGGAAVGPLAERAAGLGYDSISVGDSILAGPLGNCNTVLPRPRQRDGVPGLPSTPSLTSTSCAARKASRPAGIPQ
jgi:hypothetical protein